MKQSVINQAIAFPTFLSTLEKLAKAAPGIVNRVWDKIDDKIETPVELLNTYNKNFLKGITGADNLLKNNVSSLAAAKTNYTVKQLHDAKAAAKGNKDEYIKQAKLILARANSTQAAEYNTAVHRARVAKQWEQFQAESHLYPNIQWLRTRSATPREIHLAYGGRIWPMNDPFWKSNSPGCTWNCKCSWKTTDAAPTENNNILQVKASPGLEGNPYETKKIFSDNHPYFARVDNHVPKLGPLHNPDEIAFISKSTPSGNKYKEHFLCNDEKEIAENRKVAEIIIDEKIFKKVSLLPRISEVEQQLRIRYYGNSYCNKHYSKCPDCIADGEILEFKKTTLKNFSANIKDASKQGDVAVIELDMNGVLDKTWLEYFCKKQFLLPDRNNIKQIVVIANKAVFSYKK